MTVLPEGGNVTFMIRVQVINPLRPAAAAAAAAVSSCTFYITITTLMDGENGHWWHKEKKRYISALYF